MTPDRAYSLASAGAAPRANEDGGLDEFLGRSRNGYLAPSQPTSRAASSPGSDTLIFIHLYKTGGTTLNRIIEWEYKTSRICSVEPTWWQWSYQRITRWSPRRLPKMEVFKGHMPFGLHRLIPRPANYVTVLREPVQTPPSPSRRTSVEPRRVLPAEA